MIPTKCYNRCWVLSQPSVNMAIHSTLTLFFWHKHFRGRTPLHRPAGKTNENGGKFTKETSVRKWGIACQKPSRKQISRKNSTPPNGLWRKAMDWLCSFAGLYPSLWRKAMDWLCSFAGLYPSLWRKAMDWLCSFAGLYPRATSHAQYLQHFASKTMWT